MIYVSWIGSCGFFTQPKEAAARKSCGGTKVIVRDNRQQTIDAYVGYRLRNRRRMSRMSQGRSGAGAVGTSYQQIQRYETGHYRIPASHLWEPCRALHVSIDDQFNWLPRCGHARPAENVAGENDSWSIPDGDATLLLRGEAPVLVRCLVAIRSPAIRAEMIALIRALGNSESPSRS